MTQYLISVHHAEGGPELSEAEAEKAMAQVGAFNTELRTGGAWVFAGGLEPPSSATVIDATGSEVMITDGPYVETKEQLGGFWVIEAPDLDAALDLGRRGSAACLSPVEVRPFQSGPA